MAFAVLLLCLGGCGQPAPDPALFPFEHYLLEDRVPHLVIHIHHSAGWAPTELTLAGLEEQILLATGRDRVDVRVAGVVATTGTPEGVWTAADLARVHDQVLAMSKDGVAAMTIVFLDGRYEDTQVAGLAYMSVAFVFTEALAELAELGPLAVPDPDHAAKERAAAVHELGHMLGLVNVRVPRGHGTVSEDGQHSGDPDSVMYPAVDTIGLAGLDPDQISYRFTADDIADLRDYQRSRGFEP